MALDSITQKVLLDWIVDLDIPEGLRVELIEGEVVVTPAPDGHHQHCVSGVVSQVHQRSSTDMQFSGNKGLKLRSADGCPQDHVIPDGMFAPKEQRLYRGADPWMPCEGVTMVLEVTSRRRQTEREIKRRCYARGGVPLYLLIDRDTGWITLFGAPESDDYQELHAVTFGKPLSLPAPFAFDLETTDFV
ncbi:Uma2 family endonuclease [Streptomyces sp. NBC_00287]|uniref:Uma2 family endonuclease n=1 Tax=Streptomyces sp. NBC_00287 TaxID=2975702 RepID=UPI002E2A6B1B|nr:Uma2 family endonuclease [Streptomyces sp. NBC_00287]